MKEMTKCTVEKFAFGQTTFGALATLCRKSLIQSNMNHIFYD